MLPLFEVFLLLLFIPLWIVCTHVVGSQGDIKLIDVERGLLYGLLEDHKQFCTTDARQDMLYLPHSFIYYLCINAFARNGINALAFSPSQPDWLLSADNTGHILLWKIGKPRGDTDHKVSARYGQTIPNW